MSVTMTDANGNDVDIFTVSAPDGSGAKAAAHVLVPVGADFSFFPNDAVVTPGTPIRALAANTSRSGGYVQAADANAGKITVTLTKADGVTTLVYSLRAGDRIRFDIFPGRVLQQAVAVTGDTAGDHATTVEYA